MRLMQYQMKIVRSDEFHCPPLLPCYRLGSFSKAVTKGGVTSICDKESQYCLSTKVGRVVVVERGALLVLVADIVGK